MSFEVHREPLYRRYYAPLFSGACCYFILFAFVLIFLPLIIAYNSSEFWLKESIYYDQPTVQYKYQLLLQLFGTTSEGGTISLFYSTSPTINQFYGPLLRIPVLRSAEIDENRDGNVDRIEVNLLMPLAMNEKITSINAMLYHDVTLSSKTLYSFDALSYISYDSSAPIRKLTADGDLFLHQSWPLSSIGGYHLPYSDEELIYLVTCSLCSGEELISLGESTSPADVTMAHLLAMSSARNLSLRFQPRYQYGERVADLSSTDTTTTRYCNISIIERIPKQPIRYSPNVSEVLKYAWIQYISFFAVVSFLLFRLNSFLFRHQLVYTYSVPDVLVEKLD